jgi:hypothetical protein
VVDRDGVVETFLSYLRDHNLPVTQQRIDFARVLLGSDRHLSVEERLVIHAVCASCRSGAAT